MRCWRNTGNTEEARVGVGVSFRPATPRSVMSCRATSSAPSGEQGRPISGEGQPLTPRASRVQSEVQIDQGGLESCGGSFVHEVTGERKGRRARGRYLRLGLGLVCCVRCRLEAPRRGLRAVVLSACDIPLWYVGCIVHALHVGGQLGAVGTG